MNIRYKREFYKICGHIITIRFYLVLCCIESRIPIIWNSICFNIVGCVLRENNFSIRIYLIAESYKYCIIRNNSDSTLFSVYRWNTTC